MWLAAWAGFHGRPHDPVIQGIVALRMRMDHIGEQRLQRRQSSPDFTGPFFLPASMEPPSPSPMGARREEKRACCLDGKSELQSADCVRAIHRAPISWGGPSTARGRIALTQSANDGMQPRSSRTCCSPIQRTGMARPSAFVMVVPKIVSRHEDALGVMPQGAVPEVGE